MSIDRQNKLLLAEDWKKIYQTFRNADFQSYDFENIRRILIDYIRTNYPESFNDYIESSEYLALIDLIAFVSQSIAFRVDLNARNNFLELAERRDSILRTARMLSYIPKRNIPAQGLLKFATVQTTENILDSTGRNLSGQVITWNDSTNSNWKDQFIKVINAALNLDQQYGNPIDKKIIYGIVTEQYRFQGANNDIPLYSFSKVVSSRSMTFEITSTTFKDQDYIYEESPKVGNKLAFLYRDDGQGAGSANSGFFINMVQGILNTGSFTITQPSTNEIVDIESQGINNKDIWLYRLDQNGTEIEEWAQVPDFKGNNVIYNSLSRNIRNLYSVITRAGDTISLSFSDGTFGNLPLGSFRVYYRISNGLEYVITPQDIRNVAISVPYISNRGQPEVINITLALQTTVANATSSETDESVKRNAPAAYYTQNRMITGEDYNISPLTVNQQVAKIKSVNRTSSGISRYFDLIDPTGKYSSITLFASDGVLYQENYLAATQFSYREQADIEGTINNVVNAVLASPALKHYFYSKYIKLVGSPIGEPDVVWQQTSTTVPDLAGKFTDSQGIAYLPTMFSTHPILKYMKSGALVKFSAPQGQYFDTQNLNKLVSVTVQTARLTSYIWSEIISIQSDTNLITLSKRMPSGAIITEVIPKYVTTLTPSTMTAMTSLIYDNKPFGLRYDELASTWRVIDEKNLNLTDQFSLQYAGTTGNSPIDSSWLLAFLTDNRYYTIKAREVRYVFESDREIEFYFNKSNKIYDTKNTKLVKDLITVLGINSIANETCPLVQDFNWEVLSEYTGTDGYFDKKKVRLTFADDNDNGIADDPDIFVNIVDPADPSMLATDPFNAATKLPTGYIVQEKYSVSSEKSDYRYTKNADDLGNTKVIIANKEPPLARAAQHAPGQYFYFIETDTVKKLNQTKTQLIPSLDYKVFQGRDQLKFRYIHSADYSTRIDPGVSNIMDIFVLTKAYDVAFRQWLSGARDTKPLPVSTAELHNMLAPSLNLIKPVSDEIVFHPVKYKLLFGKAADIENQSIFKIVKLPRQVISDNDIKARVISAINQFFELENWEFGDTFYFSEMATYVMNRLAPNIANFVIVPRQSGLNFGSLFEIKSASDQLFISCATVDDVEIIPAITNSNIKSISNTVVDDSSLVQQYTTSAPYGELQ